LQILSFQLTEYVRYFITCSSGVRYVTLYYSVVQHVLLDSILSNSVPIYLSIHLSAWLDIPQRVQYKLCATVHRCLRHKASQFMTDCCTNTSDIARRQHLRSAGCRQLHMPWHRRSMFGRPAFSVAGPTAWNSLADYLRDPTRSLTVFIATCKILFSHFTDVHSALGALHLCTI